MNEGGKLRKRGRERILPDTHVKLMKGAGVCALCLNCLSHDYCPPGAVDTAEWADQFLMSMQVVVPSALRNVGSLVVVPESSLS
jgi:hypothetical protein